MNNKINALMAAAKNKHEIALKKANGAIDEMIRSNQIITFANIARKANVTKAWLYREASIRDKINILRQNSNNLDANNNTEIKSEQSYITSLENKIYLLEKMNSALKKQIEILYGKYFIQQE